MHDDKVYLYAVIPRSQDGYYLAHGVRGLPVLLCSHDDLSAAISLVPAGMSPHDGWAHRQVIQRLVAHAAVLPAPEGTMLASLSALQELLTANQQQWLEQIRHARGLIEVRLQVFTRCAVSTSTAPGSTTGAEQNGVTQSYIADERDYILARYSRALLSGGFQVQALPPRHAQTILHLACLLPWHALDLLLLTCKAFGKQLEPAYELMVSQPMAPVDFIKMHLPATAKSTFCVAASAPIASAAAQLAASTTAACPLRS